MERAPLFVGRGPELEKLRARLESATAGTATVAALVGEPGIGKTRTAAAFGALARARGALVLSGASTEGVFGPPFAPWTSIVRGALGVLGAARVLRALGASGAALRALVPDHDELPELPSLGAREDRLRLFDAVAQLVALAACEAPLVLAIEDLHWADGDTVALFRHVARVSAKSRVVTLVTFRESEIEPRGAVAELLAALRRETDYQRIPLRGFAPAEVAEYLRKRAGADVPDALVRHIVDDTVGNPFHVRELYRFLTE
jgi:predicted ATPase